MDKTFNIGKYYLRVILNKHEFEMLAEKFTGTGFPNGFMLEISYRYGFVSLKRYRNGANVWSICPMIYGLGVHRFRRFSENI